MNEYVNSQTTAATVAGSDLRSQKAKAYTGISPVMKALLSTDRPRWEFLAAVSIDQRAAHHLCSEILIDRPAVVVASSSVAASGRGSYASNSYKTPV